MKYIIAVVTIGFMMSCNGNDGKDVDHIENDPSLKPVPSGIPAPQSISYSLINEFPHDTSSFTEGLEFHHGKLYESAGEYSSSALQYGDHKTGIITEKHKLPNEIFGEGITILNGKIYQLTYQTNIGYVYDLNDIKKTIKTFKWPYEGWGMTNNGKDLIIDTGGPNLYFVDPETFQVKNTLAVVDDKGPVSRINELEWIDGFIWANVWLTNRIIKIDPESGHVVGELFMNSLASEDGSLKSPDAVPDRTDVLNGIAYDSTSKTIMITGKRWPKLYQLRIN